MAVNDYKCAQMGCDRPATAVRIAEKTGALYGSCDNHMPSRFEVYKWLYPPQDKRV